MHKQATGEMSTHELLKGLTALRERVDPTVLEATLKGEEEEEEEEPIKLTHARAR